MSFPHHGEEFRKEQSELMKMFEDQRKASRQRSYSQGRLSADDDGDVAFKISSDAEKSVVRIDFPKPMTWIAMNPQEAIELAQMLIKQARAVSREPIRISLH